MRKEKVEIIIPVYNTPQKDLARCIESLKAQTYSNWSAILVDDGSNNETASYLDSLGKEDKRIRIFHKKNEGVSVARNYGISKSSAPFLAFVDADDCIFSNFLIESVELLEKFDLDMIIGGIEVVDFDNKKSYSKCNSSGDILQYNVDNKECLLDYMLSNCHREDNENLGNAWCGRVFAKLYRADLIKDLKFPEHIKMSEDNIFTVDVILKAKKIGVCPNLWYQFYRNLYSAQHAKKDPKIRVQEQLDFADRIYEKKELMSPRTYEALMIRLAMIYCRSIGCLGQLNNKNNVTIVEEFNNRGSFKTMLKDLNTKKYLDCPVKVKVITSIAKIPVKPISYFATGLLLKIANIKNKISSY